MRILEVQDGICVLTDDSNCLECGTCMRECPKNALSIEEGISEKEIVKESLVKDKQSGRTKGEIQFTPILKELNDLLQELNPVQVYEYEEVDIREFDDFEIEGEKCYARLYKADKVEKIGVVNMNFFGLMTAKVLSIRPTPEYDIPLYILDWDESEEHIFFICDLTPSDDPGRNVTYLTNYLYNTLEDLYQRYCTIPGLKNSVFHWVRATSSPYVITGTIKKKPWKNIDMIFNCARDYLKAWIKICKEAQLQDPNSDYMKLVHERRETIRGLLREYDPGLGPLKKFLGDKKAQAVMSIVES